MHKKLSEYTKDERSLLLFFETAAVDYGGKLNARHMNDDDFKTADKWTIDGFITFERVASQCLPTDKPYAVFLSDDAWKIAHEERKNRAFRLNEKRKWLTISEI